MIMIMLITRALMITFPLRHKRHNSVMFELMIMIMIVMSLVGTRLNYCSPLKFLPTASQNITLNCCLLFQMKGVSLKEKIECFEKIRFSRSNSQVIGLRQKHSVVEIEPRYLESTISSSRLSRTQIMLSMDIILHWLAKFYTRATSNYFSFPYRVRVSWVRLCHRLQNLEVLLMSTKTPKCMGQ